MTRSYLSDSAHSHISGIRLQELSDWVHAVREVGVRERSSGCVAKGVCLLDAEVAGDGLDVFLGRIEPYLVGVRANSDLNLRNIITISWGGSAMISPQEVRRHRVSSASRQQQRSEDAA
jgi:hypothetical protein